MDLCRMLLEISGNDRLNILRELKKEANVTTLSELADLTTQEARRQVFRLKQARLLLKDQKGFYRLTSYAEPVHALRKLVLNEKSGEEKK